MMCSVVMGLRVARHLVSRKHLSLCGCQPVAHRTPCHQQLAGRRPAASASPRL